MNCRRKPDFRIKPLHAAVVLSLLPIFLCPSECLGEEINKYLLLYESTHFENPTLISVNGRSPSRLGNDAALALHDDHNDNIVISGGPIAIEVNPTPAEDGEPHGKLSAVGHKVYSSVATNEEKPDHVFTIDFQPELTINLNSFKHLESTNFDYNQAEGIKYEAAGSRGYQRSVNKVTYRAPVKVTMKNVSEVANSPSQENAMGICLNGHDDGVNDLVFEKELTVDTVGVTQTRMVGFLMEDKNNTMGASSCQFADDVSINVQSGESIELLGLATNTNSETNNESIQKIDFSQAGDLLITVQENGSTDNCKGVYGFRQSVTNGAAEAKFAKNNTIHMNNKHGENHAMFFNIWYGNSSFDSVGNTEIELTGASGKKSTGVFSQGVDSTIDHAYEDISITLDSKDSYGLNFMHYSGSDAKYVFNGKTVLNSSEQNPSGALVYTTSYQESTMDMAFSDIHMTTPNGAVFSYARSGGAEKTSIGNAFVRSKRSGFTSDSDGKPGSVSEIRFTGALDLRAPKLFTATGSNARIQVESDRQAPRSLFGTARASSGAEVSLSLSGADNKAEMDAYCHDGSPDHLGEVNIRLTNKAEWSVRNDIDAIAGHPSMISRLDLSDGGLVNLTNLVGGLQPGENPSLSLATRELKGDGGVIKLNVNTAKETARWY